MMLINELYSSEELMGEIAKIKDTIYNLNLSIESTESQIEALIQSDDENSLMLQILNKKADRLTSDYLYNTALLERYLKAIELKDIIKSIDKG
jgi:hypothetical protein